MEESQQLTNEDENIFTYGFDEIKSRKYMSHWRTREPLNR